MSRRPSCFASLARVLALVWLRGTLACHSQSPTAPTPTPTPPSLVSQAKQALSARERLLSSYHLVVDSTQGEERAHHEFFFRSPNRSRGTIAGPHGMSVAFDGQRLFRMQHAERSFVEYQIKLPREKAALLLASVFQPFAPDGFRSPLLPARGVSARHVDATGAVEVTVSAHDEAGETVQVTYALRLPSADFLEKRTRAGAHVRVLKMEKEHCDAALKLCVPTRLVELEDDGSVLGVTTVARVELNPPLGQSEFSLVPPPGYSTARQVLEEATVQERAGQ